MSEAIDVVIRQATGNDAVELVKSIAQMKSETSWVEIDDDAFDLPIEKLAMQIDALAQHPSNLLLIAVLEEEIIGLVTIRESDDRGKTAEFGIVVKKEFWGMGLGSMMMDESLFWAKEFSDLDSLYLAVYTENNRAIQLYEKMGFVFKESLEANQQKMTYSFD